jgi:hypothetical protein
MPQRQSPETYDVHLSDVSKPKEEDSTLGHGRDDKESDSGLLNGAHAEQVESDTTSTNSSDEFDWDDELSATEEGTHESKKARRGRALWLAFMKLARPVRTLLVGIIGTAFFITPLLVVELRFQSNTTVRPQVFVWSLWFSITWATSCATYLIVDLLPKTIVTVILFLGGQVERLKTQVEVFTHLSSRPPFPNHAVSVQLTLAVSGWLKLLLDVSWAWIALSAIREFYKPPGSYWIIINRVMQV